MRILILILIIIVFSSSWVKAELVVKGNYTIKGNKTYYTKSLTRHTIGSIKPKKPIKGDTFEDKKTGKKEKWSGKVWQKLSVVAVP